MITRDMDNTTKARLYDVYQEKFPARTEKYREQVRLLHPGYSDFAVRCVVMERFEQDAPGILKEMRKQIAMPRPEPKRMSPTELIKIRTSILNPNGEITGGNYGASL